MSRDKYDRTHSPSDSGTSARGGVARINQPQIRALVVDDSGIVARALANLIEQSFPDEIALTVKTDSVAASRWIEDNQPDIVITDLEMPGLDGLEIVRTAKTGNAWSQAIVYSSTVSTSKVAQALRAGATDFVSKFGHADDILDSLRAACDRLRRWRRDLE
jgi:CheY-like chemotaxis protein